MLAFITRDPRTAHASLLPIAGRPLIARQLEWLYDLGVDEIFIELSDTPSDAALRDWLDRSPLRIRVRALTGDARGRDLASLADEAGVPADLPVVQLARGTAACADLTPCFAALSGAGVAATIRGGGAGLEPATVVVARPRDAVTVGVELDGWGATVRSETQALLLTHALLEARRAGLIELTVHGVELVPGVWAGRGALVDRRAVLCAPAFIADGAWIQAGAQVGPHCYVGERAVVRAGARATETIIPDHATFDVGGATDRGEQAADATRNPGLTRQLGYLLAAPFVAAAMLAKRKTGGADVTAPSNARS